MGASESKLSFKQGVFRLAEDENIPVDSELWAQFYQLPESAEDVFTLWSPNDLHNLTLNNADNRPPPGTQTAPKKNLETLIYACIARLAALQHGHCYADPHKPIAPEVLNCVRILTRVLPYIYEADHLREWEDNFFWKPRKAQQIWDKKNNRPGEYFDGLNPAKKYRQEDYNDEVCEREIGPPLGETLINLLVRYLFFPGFTAPKKLDAQGLPDLKVQYHIWNSGIGCRQSVGMTKENEWHAVEVIRLLLSLCSRQLYIQPYTVADTNVRSLGYMTSQPDRQVALSMICSLLNTVMKFNPASWRVPLDFTMEGDPRTRLVHLSLQLLLVLLLYPDPLGEINQYRKALGRLHRVEDFQFIQQGITMVLMQPISGISVPGLNRPYHWAPEMQILFWELLQVNKRFRAFITETDRAHDFLILTMYYIMVHKDEQSKMSLVRMGILTLQTMSVESSFGKRLNKEFVSQESLPTPLRINKFHGSYADFLIATIHTLMTTTHGRLETMYPSLLAIVNNVAPYVQDLQRASSSKILDLFVQFSSPKFLLDKENNHNTLISLLRAMNTILEYQFESNRRFVEVIVRSRKRFQALRDFSIEGAVAEIDRRAQEMKDRNVNLSTAAMGSDVRNPVRKGSVESSRSPPGPQSPRLRDLPENGVFAIGEDDEDENESRYSTRLPQSTESMSVEDAVPLQSRSMSDKARGKQPVGQTTFSRSTSRNTSTASLPSLNTVTQASTVSPSTSSQFPFRPSVEWLETWIPHLPLHTILQVIDHELTKSSRHTSVDTDSPALSATDNNMNDSAPTVGTPRQSDPPSEGRLPQSQAFVWTSASLGWYLSLLWGLIYASDIATNKGINGIWTGTNIRLFNVINSQGSQISLKSPKGAVDYVGDSIARRISNFSFSNSSQQTTKDV